MITEAFDDKSEAIISPASFYPTQQRLCDIAIGTFSLEIYRTVLERFQCRQIAQLKAANHVKQLWLVETEQVRFAFYLSEIGSALASTDVIEVNWFCGATKFILFGSAGALDNSLTQGKYIIPTEAYRDEGMSYHYAPPQDYITIKNADCLQRFFAENDLPFISGKAWTTDAFYRETRLQLQKRKSEGCVVVDMELAGLQAVCDFYGFELYDFLVTGDIVDQIEYTPEGLSEANHSMDKMFIALKLAQKLAQKLAK